MACDAGGGHGEIGCPTCGVTMSAGSIGGVELDLCPACRGVWLDGGEWTAVFGGAAREGAREGAAREGAARGAAEATLGRRLACPRCAAVGAAATLAVRCVAGEVEIDACPRCDGAFLDAGEMAGVVEALRRERAYANDANAKRGETTATAATTAAAPATAAALELFRAIVRAFRREGDGDGPGDERSGPIATLTPTPDGAGLSVRFACAQCGAPVIAGLDDRIVPCEHCGCWSRLHGSALTEALVLDCEPLGDEQLAAAWIERRVAIVRAEATPERGETQHVIGSDLPTARAVAAGRAERRRLRGLVRVGERHLIHVPYVHRHAVGHRLVLRREADGSKRLVVAGVLAEETDAAHDTRGWSFRDANLRLHHARMRVLSAEDMARGFSGLPVRVRRGPEPSFDPALRRPAGAEVLARTSSSHRRRRVIAYAPYWLAEVSDERATRWLLIEGRSGQLAATIRDPAELERLREPELASPFPDEPPEPPRVVPHRCLECDAELPIDRTAWMRPCENCHVGLARGDGGLERIDYAHVPSHAARAAWLPAWRFRITPPREHRELRGVLGDLGLDSPGADDRTAFAWVPARRVLGGPIGDRAFARFASEARRRRWAPVAERLPPAAQERILGATVTAEEAARAVPAALAASLTGDEVLRLDRDVVRDALGSSRWRCEEATLVLLPGRTTRHGGLQLQDCTWEIPRVVLERDGGG